MSVTKIKNIFKNNYIALFAGALCALAFAPFHFFPAAMISLTIFYFLLDEKNTRREIFWCGFFYGYGFFLAGIYWIAISLLVDAAQFAWLIPFALTLIPAALALYMALLALTYKFLARKISLHKPYQKILLFSLCWTFFEILRATLFTGFPWNLLGYMWMFNLKISHAAAIFGIYGLSILAALFSLLPVLFLNNTKFKKFSTLLFGDKVLAAATLSSVLLALIFGHFDINESKLLRDPQSKLRLVQANIKQEMKWNPDEKLKNLAKHIAMTNSKSLENVKAVIWSETSVPYVIDDNPGLLMNLRYGVPTDGVLITGGLRVEYADEDRREVKGVWNSVFVLNKSGVVDHYDKHHLVPFGEYIPFHKFFPFVDKITGGGEGFSEGEGAQTLLTESFSFSPLVCYEVIFSDEVVNKKLRPDLLVNLTNDAWFGNSSGPYQHFDMAVMRAIEYGIPLVRVAGTGISAFIDPFGRVVAKLDLNEEGVIDVDLVKNTASTIYADYGYLPLILLVLIMSLILTITPRKKHDPRQNYTD